VLNLCTVLAAAFFWLLERARARRSCLIIAPALRAPPEGVLDDLMNNVDPSDPYGGPVWGMQSGDIGSTYEYGGQPVMLTGQNSDAQAKMQKLWMFNMGYEHHEQV
jgi:hypothetical protein